MSTAGDPAASIIEPRTPTPYLGIGAAAFVGATASSIWLVYLIATSPHAPNAVFAIAAAAAMLGCLQVGLWGLQQNRQTQRAAKIGASDEARYVQWIDSEEARQVWIGDQFNLLQTEIHAAARANREEATAAVATLRAELQELGRAIHRASGQRGINDLMTMVDQLGDRVTVALMKRAEAEEVERQILARLTSVEVALAAVASPNVLDLGAARDLRTIQQRFDDDADRG